MRITLLSLSVSISVFFGFFVPTGSAATLEAYLFWGEGCPHCAKEKDFLGLMAERYPGLSVNAFEVYRDQENVQLLLNAAKALGSRVSGVPFLVIGDKPFSGYADGVSPAVLEKRIKECLETGCPDSLAALMPKRNADVGPRLGAVTIGRAVDPGGTSGTAVATSSASATSNVSSAGEGVMDLPVIGDIDPRTVSLPVLTVVMGLLDGFNPCAMWTLLFLISLLLGMKDRRRMWILGAVFIIASSAVYFLFMAAWLNLILFLGFIVWIRLLIGFLALAGGGYSLKDFFVNKEGACKVGDVGRRRAVFERIKTYVGEKSLLFAMGGIIVLAFMVNLVELVCSAGLPAVYTQVLALNGLSAWQYYLYILAYIFFFMFDDLLVFFIAMVTLEMTPLGTRYQRISRLVGGLIMLAIGLLLIFKPEWLMFG